MPAYFSCRTDAAQADAEQIIVELLACGQNWHRHEVQLNIRWPASAVWQRHDLETMSQQLAARGARALGAAEELLSKALAAPRKRPWAN